MKRLLLLSVLAAIFAVFAYALTRETTLASPLIGRAAPFFEIPLFEPTPEATTADPVLALSDLSGKPVVLNFWASWCLSCRDEAAVLEAGWRRYGPDVAFVGIAVNDEPDAARAFIERYGKTYLIGPDRDGSVAVDYGLYGVPETFFIAPDGRVLSRYVGPLTPDDLDRQVTGLTADLLGEAGGDPNSVMPLDRGDDPR